MTREPASSRKSAVVLSPEGEVEGHVVEDEGVEQISPEREIVYVPYESVPHSDQSKSAASPNFRSTIILSNLLVAVLVALYFHFAGSRGDSDANSKPNDQTTLANAGGINKIDRSDQVDDGKAPLLQPIAQLKMKAGLIIDDEKEDIGLVNSFLDSWREIAPSTKQSFKSSFWFKQFTDALSSKISHLRSVSPYNESSQIYAGTLLNLAALLGIQSNVDGQSQNTIAANNAEMADNNTNTIVAGEISGNEISAEENSEVNNNGEFNSLSGAINDSDPMLGEKQLDVSGDDAKLEKEVEQIANSSESGNDSDSANNNQISKDANDFSDIVSELSSQIAKLEADQKNQVEDESLHKADLVKNSHSVIGNTTKGDSGYSESDLHYLLGQYATTYEFGDTEKLLALFAAKPDYRRALKRNFKKVFAYSESRHIEFSNLDWKFYKNSIIGEGRYKAKIELKRNKGTRYVSADILVTMLPGKHDLKIARLDFSKVKSKTIKPKTSSTTKARENSAKKSTPSAATKSRQTIGKAYESIHKSNSKPKGPTAAELQDIITRFIGAYESGNIKALDGIFSANARTNDRNNLKEIKSDYKSFFSHTTDRQLFIKDLKWTVNKDLAKGIGNLNALVVKTDSEKINSINGEVEIVAQRINNKVLITHLFHNYSLSKN